MSKENKLTKTHLLRYDEEMDRQIDDTLKEYSEPVPSRSAIIRAAITLGLKMLKEHQQRLKV